MASPPPRWRRRADARPGEIADAALQVFAAQGYAAARLADIAARAGVSKTALYLYYPTKEALFRAVLLDRLSPRIAGVEAAAAAAPADVQRIAAILNRVASILAEAEAGRLARIVIGESGNFPELARAWHDTVVGPALGALTAAIAAGQRAGRLRDGDARLMAMSMAGPMLIGAIWREVIEPIGGAPLDLAALASEHARTLAVGLGAMDDGRSGRRPPLSAKS